MRFAALMFLGAVFAFPGFVEAAEPSKPAVVAVLDSENSNRIPLLELKLAAEPGLTLVERSTVDAALKEQQLQAAFGPQGVGERVRLGKVFKADVLVMVRPVPQAKEPAVEVVVSETDGGLRLLVRAASLTKDAEADADALAAAVREGLDRRAASIDEIVAVPPFVSQDLGYAFDHLKAAFAKLAENAAMTRPGVVAVELAEAEAIAKELVLAAPGETLQRRLPLYLLGEFRHSTERDRKVRIRLHAERGGKPIGTKFDRELEPDDAPLAIRNWTSAAMVGSTVQATPAAEDSKAEARQLAARARDFKRLGNCPEALSLFEAALLLDPQQIETHVDVLKTIGPPIHDLWIRINRRDMKTMEEFVRLYRRGLEHIEAFVVRGGDVSKYYRTHPAQSSLVMDFRTAGNYLHISDHSTPQQRELMQDAQRFERALFQRLIPKTYHLQQIEHRDFLQGAVDNLTDAERLELLEKLIGELPDVPRSVEVAQWYAQAAARAAVKVGDERKTFEARLAAGRSAASRVAAAEFPRLFQIALDQSKPPTYVPPARNDPERPDGVKLTPLSLSIDGPHPKHSAPDLPCRRINGVLQLGSATDLIVGSSAFYLMKEKGKLRPVVGLNGLSGVHVQTRFDGECVWLSNGRSDQRPLLFVLDPVSERVWNVSQADGLPLLSAERLKLERFSSAYHLAPLGPGRVCLAGRLGDHAWVGVATFDKTTGLASVKIVFEARDVPDPLDSEQWASPTLAFTPFYIQPLADPNGTTAVRMLVGRSKTGSPFSQAEIHPLLIDPAGVAKPEVIREPIGRRCQERGGEGYFLEPTFNSTGRLRKVKLPGPTLETVADGIPTQAPVIQAEGNRWHAVETIYAPRKAEGGAKGITCRNDPFSRTWWTVEPDAKTPRIAGTDLPPIQDIAMSAHYGFVAVVMQDPDASMVLYKVDVQPEPK